MDFHSNNWVVRLHERDILELSLMNKALQKQINRNNAQIKKLRNYNREIKGRPVEKLEGDDRNND